MVLRDALHQMLSQRKDSHPRLGSPLLGTAPPSSFEAEEPDVDPWWKHLDPPPAVGPGVGAACLALHLHLLAANTSQ